MITLYLAKPGFTGIRELYDMADKRAKENFNSSPKKTNSYYSLFCRVLLKKALMEFGVDPENIEIYTNKYGKEYVRDMPVYYNISHTSGLICAAVSNHEIGVDCETVRNIDYHLISKRFFTKEEAEAVENAFNGKEEFFRIWTKKESYIKFTGEGFSQVLNSFNAFDFDDIQSTFKVKNTFVTLTGDVSNVNFRYERI